MQRPPGQGSQSSSQRLTWLAITGLTRPVRLGLGLGGNLTTRHNINPVGTPILRLKTLKQTIHQELDSGWEDSWE
jgi:hypothetical protein